MRAVKLIFGLILFILIISCTATLHQRDRGPVLDGITVEQVEEILREGWQHLWNNEYKSAEEAFSLLIAPQSASPEALRGRGLTRWILAQEEEAVEDLVCAIEMQPEQAISVVIRDFLSGQVLKRKSIDLLLDRASSEIASSDGPVWIRREGLSSQTHYAANLHSNLTSFKRLNEKLNWIKGWTLIGPFSNVSGSGFNKEFIDESRLSSGCLVYPNGALVPDQNTSGSSTAYSGGKKRGGRSFEQLIPDLPPYLDRAGQSPYRGINNMPVNWFKPVINGASGVLPLQYLNSFASPVGYAWKQISVPKTGEYLVVITKGGAIKLWLDGKLLLVDEEETYGNERHYLRLQLEAGSHFMLVKLAGETTSLVMRIALEFLDENDRRLLDSRDISSSIPGLTQMPEWPAPVLPDPLLNQLGLAVDGEPHNPEASFWLAYMLKIKGFPAAGLELLNKIKGQYPESALLDHGRIICMEDMGDQEAEIQRLIHQICDRDLNSPRARASLVAKLLARESLKPAERELVLLKEQAPNWIQTYLMQAGLHFHRSQFDEAFRVIDTAEKQYQDAPDLFQLQILRAAKHLEHGRFEQLLHKIAANGRKSQADNYLLELEMDREQFSLARSRINRMLSFYPTRKNALLSDCMARLRTGEEDVLIYANNLLRSFPYDNDLLDFTQSVLEYYRYSLTDLADDKQITDNDFITDIKRSKNKAERNLETLYSWRLSIDPRQYQIRKQLREIRGSLAVDEFVESYDSYDLIRDYEATDLVHDTDASFVLDDECRIFFADGAERHYYHSVIHVLTQGGVEQFINRPLVYHPLFSDGDIQLARVIHADGTIEDASVGSGYATYTGLKPGDYVELKYTVNYFRSGWLNGEFWASFQLNSSMPSFVTRFTEVHQQPLNPKIVIHNGSNVQLNRETISPTVGFTGTQIDVSRLDAVDLETAMDLPQDVYCWIDISTISDWQKISSWYQDLSFSQAEDTPSIRNKAEELCAMMEAGQDTITVLADFVAREIEYDVIDFHRSNYIPANATTVLRHGFGDCKDKSTLLIALCRTVGIDANIVLSMSTYSGNHPFLPSPRFNHAIVYFPDKDRFLDPTSDAFEVTGLPEHLYGTIILPIGVEYQHTELLRLLPTYDLFSTSVMDLRADQNGEIEIQGHLVMNGTNAAIIRTLLAHGTADVKLKNFSSLLNTWIPGLHISSLDCSQMEDLSGPLEISYMGTIPVPEDQERCYFSLPWIFTHDFFPGLESEQRSHILVHDSEAHAIQLRQELRFHTGSGLRVLDTPADAFFAFADARLSYRYQMEDGILVCVRQDLVPDLKVEPEAFSEYRQFALAVLDKERENLWLSVD